MYALKDLSMPDSEPAGFLSHAIENLPTGGHDAQLNFEYHIRMFVSIVRSALREEIKFIMESCKQSAQSTQSAQSAQPGQSVQSDHSAQSVESTQSAQSAQSSNIGSLVNNYIAFTRQTASNYRELGGRLGNNKINPALAEYFHFGDEYLSNVIEQHTFKLIKGLKITDTNLTSSEINLPVSQQRIPGEQKPSGYKDMAPGNDQPSYGEEIAPDNEQSSVSEQLSSTSEQRDSIKEDMTSRSQEKSPNEHNSSIIDQILSGSEELPLTDQQGIPGELKSSGEKPPTDKQTSPISELMKLITEEIEYRKSKGMLIVEKHSKTRNRELVFRLSMLKKYAENELFLDARRQREGILTEQIWLSIAAGISMVFATAIAFSFQRQYGNLTMPFFVALVISYMLKDRIKELARYLLAHRVGRRFFDIKTKVSLNENRIGWSKEGMDFIDEKKVPSEVLRMRQRSSILEAENRNNSEQIILYRKLVRLRRDILNKVSPYPLAGINDIIRINVSSLIQKMDNPEVPLFIPGDDGSPDTVKGEKMYYLNLVMRLRHSDGIKFRRYRIVMNRNGIAEVENFQ